MDGRNAEEAARALGRYFSEAINPDELTEIKVTGNVWKEYQKRFTDAVYFGYVRNGEITRIIDDEGRGGFEWTV